MDFLFIILLMAFGMIGGQVHKATRRFGIPLLTTIYMVKDDIKNKKGKLFVNLSFLLLIPFLILGYGENSKLYKIFRRDWIVRIVYGLFLSIPFCLYIYLMQMPWILYIICIVSLVGAYSVRAGRLGYIGDFDFLIEDMLRFAVIGRLIILLKTGG